MRSLPRGAGCWISLPRSPVSRTPAGIVSAESARCVLTRLLSSLSRIGWGSVGNGSRDISGLLLILRWRGHFDLPDLELPVEVGQLAAGVLQEKLSLQKQHGTEYVEKQNSARSQNPCAVGMKQDTLVGGHELQLAHEPEPVGEKESDGDEEGV